MVVPRSPKPTAISDCLLFFSGAFLSLLLFLSFSSFLSPAPPPTHSHSLTMQQYPSLSQNIYDDPSLTYTLTEPPVKDWDLKRAQWLSTHEHEHEGKRILLMVSGSQPGPCRNPIGDHLLLQFYKNKADYCRLHDIPLLYNTALLQPRMFSFWAKIPVIRAAMIAHPEAEWIWWVDSDAAFTDMELELPLHKYRDHNLVVHGWPSRVYEARSWTGLNAGVLLFRNCQWSVDFIHRWSKMGPQSPEYEEWGGIQRSVFKDKLYEESDDQTGIAYLLVNESDRWADKVYLEHAYYLEGYWVDVVNKLDEIAKKKLGNDATTTRRRRAEKESTSCTPDDLDLDLNNRPPFITHFTGCQPCTGKHNEMYSGENCYQAMQKALNFADDQVLTFYGFRHHTLFNSTGVTPLPFHLT